jgi:hypothetical protein
MSITDDIRGIPGGSESEPQDNDSKPSTDNGRRVIGPESETRGGPEATPEELEREDRLPGAKVDSPEVTVPGGFAALPPGSLPAPFFQTQGDENRQPPQGAPAPVTKAPTVDQQLNKTNVE